MCTPQRGIRRHYRNGDEVADGSQVIFLSRRIIRQNLDLQNKITLFKGFRTVVRKQGQACSGIRHTPAGAAVFMPRVKIHNRTAGASIPHLRFDGRQAVGFSHPLYPQPAFLHSYYTYPKFTHSDSFCFKALSVASPDETTLFFRPPVLLLFKQKQDIIK